MKNPCERTLAQQLAGPGALVEQLDERRHDLAAELAGRRRVAQGIDADLGDEELAHVLKGEPVPGQVRRVPHREAAERGEAAISPAVPGSRRQALDWIMPLITLTLSPTRHAVASGSVITRLEPSSKRTVIS